MALQGGGRLLQSEASRTLIYVSQKVASDSAWPFKAGDELCIRIVKDHIVVERAK